MSSEPTIIDVIREGARQATSLVRVMLPGVVESYDRATQRAVVRVAIRSRYARSDGTIVTLQADRVVNCPVQFPFSSVGGLYFDLEIGDTGLVMFSDRSIDDWKRSGPEDSAPRDPRRHDLSDGIFAPGLRADPLPSDATGEGLIVYGANIRLGSASASDYVALSSLVDDRLSKIQTKYDLHIHPTPSGPSSPTVSTIGPLPSTAATKVRAE